MFTEQQYKILRLFVSEDYITAQMVAEKLGISERSARTRIKEINDVGKKTGIEIQSKPRYGYYVEFEVRNQIEELLTKQKLPDKIPVSAEERMHFLAVYLVNLKDYIKMDDLSELLFVSRGTLSTAIREVEDLYQKYFLKIERRPRYGIRVSGKEFDIRRFLCDFIMRRELIWEIGKTHQNTTLRLISEVVQRNMLKYRKSFSEQAYQAFVEYIYVAMYRIRKDFFVSVEIHKKEDYIEKADYYFIETLASDLQKTFDIVWSENERLGLAVWLLGYNSRDQLTDYHENMVIHDYIFSIVKNILLAVYKEYHIDFRDNLELYMSLSQHMVPMDIRLKYGIKLKNPILKEIKQSYSLAFSISEFIGEILREQYETEISEDEIGYLAVIFALALEKRGKEPRRKNVWIICASGRGTSQLLKHQFEKEFHDYIENMIVSGTFELKKENLKEADLIVTTIPIQEKISIPIIEISEFMTLKDRENVRNALRSKNGSFWEQYYRKELFFDLIHGKTKMEVLKNMCESIGKYYNFQEDLYQSVISREKIASTDLGICSALPHPDKLVVEKTIVSVGILENPVFWGKRNVSIVILALVGEKEDTDIQRFYEGTIALVSDEKRIKELLEKRNYETLIHLLEN